MKVITSRKDFEEVLNTTVRKTNSLIESSNDPHIFQNILGQLSFVKNILVDQKREPTFEEIESTSIGAIAVKNFKETMPDYADLLMAISEIFCYYEEFSFLNDLK